jgi:hypothetical protein
MRSRKQAPASSFSPIPPALILSWEAAEKLHRGGDARNLACSLDPRRRRRRRTYVEDGDKSLLLSSTKQVLDAGCTRTQQHSRNPYIHTQQLTTSPGHPTLGVRSLGHWPACMVSFSSSSPPWNWKMCFLPPLARWHAELSLVSSFLSWVVWASRWWYTRVYHSGYLYCTPHTNPHPIFVAFTPQHVLVFYLWTSPFRVFSEVWFLTGPIPPISALSPSSKKY